MLIVGRIDIDFQQHEGCVQAAAQCWMLVQKPVQHMTPAAPLATDFNQYFSVAVPGQFQGRLAVGKGVTHRVIAAAIAR